MFLKMNFLIIFIGVLTIFVKMVPAPTDGETNNFDRSIQCNDLNKMIDMYTDEIKAFCTTIEILSEPVEKPDVSATILYIKDTFNRYHDYYKNMYSKQLAHSLDYYGVQIFIQYMLMKNDKVLMKNDKVFMMKLFSTVQFFMKDPNNQHVTRFLKFQYQAVTSCRLSSTIEKEYYITYCLDFYYINKAKTEVVDGLELSVNNILKMLKEKLDLKPKYDEFDFQFTSDTYLKFIQLNGNVSNGKTFDTKDSNVVKCTHSMKKGFGWIQTCLGKSKSNGQKFDIKDPKVVKAREYLINQYSLFTLYWKLDSLKLNEFLDYKIHNEKITDNDLYTEDKMPNTTGKARTVLEVFLQHYEKSLDDNYSINTGMNIIGNEDEVVEEKKDEVVEENKDEVVEEKKKLADKKNMYYINTLWTLKFIASLYHSEIKSYDTNIFVQLLIFIAKKIENGYGQRTIQLKNEHTKYKYACSKEEPKSKSDSTSKGEIVEENKGEIVEENKDEVVEEKKIISVEFSYNTCNRITCDLPHTLNIQDVLNYLIANFVIANFGQILELLNAKNSTIPGDTTNLMV